MIIRNVFRSLFNITRISSIAFMMKKFFFNFLLQNGTRFELVFDIANYALFTYYNQTSVSWLYIREPVHFTVKENQLYIKTLEQKKKRREKNLQKKMQKNLFNDISINIT